MAARVSTAYSAIPGVPAPRQPSLDGGLAQDHAGDPGGRGERRGRPVVGDRVQVDPVHRQRQQLGLGPVRDPTPLGDRVQHLRGGQVPQPGVDLERVVDGAGHEPEPRTRPPTLSAQKQARIVLSTRGISKASRAGRVREGGWFRRGLRFAPPGSTNEGALARGCGWFRRGLRFAPPGSTNGSPGRAVARLQRAALERAGAGVFRHGLRFGPPGSTNEGHRRTVRCKEPSALYQGASPWQTSHPDSTCPRRTGNP